MAEKGVIHGMAVGVSAVVLAGPVALSLLGYGAALAIQSSFDIPAELTYNSPLDLLHLSSYALSGWIEMLELARETERFRWLVYVAIGIGLAVAFVTIGIRTPKVRQQACTAGTAAGRALTKLPCAAALRAALQWLRRQALSFSLLAMCAAIPWLLVVLVSAAVAIFVIIPSAGYEGAMRHFNTWVISAEHCSPILSRSERLNPVNIHPFGQEFKAKTTPCLSIWKDGTLLAEGRHITSTDSTVILFDPVSGNVVIEPTEGRSIRVSGPSGTVLADQLRTPHTDD